LFNVYVLFFRFNYISLRFSSLYMAVETAVAQWLRCCAANRKVAGSIPNGVNGIFHCHNPFDRTMALGSTHPLTERVPVAFSGGKSGRCVRLITLLPSCAFVMKSGNLNFLEPSGPLQACNGTACIYGSKKRWCIHACYVNTTNAFKHKVLINSLVIYQLCSTAGILYHATS